jgi:hypothetical protein
VLSPTATKPFTFDLHLPVWIFYAVAWVGLALCIPLLLLRLWRQLMRPEAGEPAQHAAPH